MFSIIGDTVLDPFLGTGTTLKIAIELGRRCIGYEKLEDMKAIISRKVGPRSEQVEFLEESSPIGLPALQP